MVNLKKNLLSFYNLLHLRTQLYAFFLFKVFMFLSSKLKLISVKFLSRQKLVCIIKQNPVNVTRVKK